jgi:exosome complex component RRP4
MAERKIVIPGEILAKGEQYLPGEGTIKKHDSIISLKYGLMDESNNLVKVISLSGTYKPRRGNVVIGKVEDVTMNGWITDIGAPENAFLSLTEIPRYVNKNEMDQVFKIGDLIIAKIWGINKRGIDLSIKSRGLGKIEEGIIIEINSNKVPRVIGKEGSMVNLIKEKTGCNITVGQNGLILIKGDQIADELFAKKAIHFVVERSFVNGLTDEITKWFGENKK